MKLTKIKTTMMAGMLAASMILPGMTAFAGQAYDAVVPITKNVTVANGVTSLPADAQTIPFTVEWVNNQAINGVTLDKPNNTALTEKLTDGKTTVNVTVDGTAEKGVITDSENILTKNIIEAMDDVPGEYTFKITENESSLTTDNDGFGWTATDNSVYYLRCVVKNDGTVKYALTQNSVSSDNDDKKSGAAFSNTYNKRSKDTDGNVKALTVTKTVEGANYVPANQTYPITITFTAPTVSGDVDITKNAYTVDVTKGSLTSRTASGKVVTIVASVQDGGTITVSNIAVGATYTVEETVGTWQNFDGVTYDDNQNGTFAESDINTTVKNTFKSVTVTGVVTNVAPYVTLVVVAVAAVAAYMAMKSRVAR